MKYTSKGYTTVLVLLLFGAFSTHVYAQPETLTNADLIEMTQAGVPADVIIRKIASSRGSYDTSAKGLVELKKAQATDAVISAVLDAQAGHTGAAANFVSLPYSENSTPAEGPKPSPAPTSPREALSRAKTIAIEKSSAHPSRQALEKELMKRPDFISTGLAILRYKDTADLYIEIGRVPLSWLTHRYVYRIFDRRSGQVLAAGETTSWGSLAENLARHISRSLTAISQ